MKPGTDPKALEAQLRTELRQWQMSHYADLTMQDKEYLPKQQMFLSPGGAGVTDMREQYEDALKVLFIAAACVLLIACANLANLLLARGLRNRQQTSLRIALGASRRRLVSKALVQSLTLGVIGGAAGLCVAYLGTSLILRLAFSGPNFYVPIDASPSTPVLLFALGVSLLTGMLFGIVPAWMTSHADPVEALARIQSLGSSRCELAAKGSRGRASRRFTGAHYRGRHALAEPAQSAASELRLRDQRSVHGFD